MKREQFDAMMEEVCENRKKLVEEREKELDEALAKLFELFNRSTTERAVWEVCMDWEEGSPVTMLITSDDQNAIEERDSEEELVEDDPNNLMDLVHYLNGLTGAMCAKMADYLYDNLNGSQRFYISVDTTEFTIGLKKEYFLATEEA